MLSVDVMPIGSVHVLGEGRALLQLLPGHVAGLTGLQAGDRVQVLYWMHQLRHAERKTWLVHPGGDQSQPLRGVFATRSCTRPNPIGVSEVDVLEVRDGGLLVAGLDARDGAPLIDIKAACR